MKKIVLRVDFYNDRMKQKAMKTASGFSGVESVSVDMKDRKLTISGDVDPVKAVSKLRKLCETQIVSVGPLKEEKKEEATNNINNNAATTTPFYYQMALPQYYNQYFYYP